MNAPSRLPAAVVLILTALAAASLPAPVAAQDGAADGTLVVHVTGLGGLPVRDAEVNVSPAEADGEGTTERTDAVGNASFELPEGIYTVRVSASGYTTSTTDVTFSGGDAVHEVALKSSVDPPAADGDVVVFILDEDGDPLDGARVTIVFADRSEKDTARTDAEGRAVFKDRLYGRGEVLASKNGYREGSATFTLASAKETVELKLAEDRASEADAVVEVVVRDTDGNPLEGALVQGNTWNSRTSGFDDDTTDANGRATLRLPSGSGGVSVSHPEHYGNYASFDASDGDADLEVVLTPKPKPDATLTGVVLDQDGRPVEDATVTIHVDYRWYERSHAATSSRMAMPYHCCPDPVTVETDEEGRFEARVHAGDLAIQTIARGYAGQNDRAHVDTGAEEHVRIVLEKVPPRDAVLTGRVFDAVTGLPVTGAGVNLNNMAWSDYQYATTDAAGRFSLTTYAGYVQVNIWPNHGPICLAVDSAAPTESRESPEESTNETSDVGNSTGAGSDASYGEGDVAIMPSPPCEMQEGPRKQYYSYVTQLVLESGSNTLDARLEPKPEPSTALVGYVLDPESGEAIPGAWVNVRNEDTGEWGSAQTDEHGSYKIMVRPGHLVLDAGAEGYFAASEMFTLGDEDRVRRDVELVKGTPRWVPCDECYHHYAADGKSGVVMMESRAESAPAVAAAGGTDAMNGMATFDSDRQGANSGPNTFVGGGGGLGPYRAAGATTDRHEAPGLGLVALVAAGALVALAARRR